MLSLWEEYEAQETVCSHYVFDFDKLDMLVQANQYEIGMFGSVMRGVMIRPGKRFARVFRFNCPSIQDSLWTERIFLRL